MMFNILVVGLVALMAYIWSTKGFFSAFLHLVSTLLAAGVAFALWEPVALAIIGAAPDQPLLVDNAWGLGLGTTFALVLAILTGINLAAIKGDLVIKGPLNAVGAGLCGLIAGVITLGVSVIAVSNVRSNPDFAGYQPIRYDPQTGSLVRSNPLWLPVDTLTAGIYANLSRGSLHSSTPMADFRPNAADLGHLSRSGPPLITLKSVAKPGDVAIAGRYTVGATSPVPLSELTGDSFGARAQTVKTLDGQPISGGEYAIEGIVLVPGPGLKTERVNQIVFGAAHVSLVIRDADDTRTTLVQPFAMISQATGDSVRLGRWRFDGPEVFVTSVGGSAEPPMAFEFLVPKGSVPQAVIVRNLRISLLDSETDAPRKPFEQFSTIADRDAAIRSRDLFAAAIAAAPMNTEGAAILRGLNTESSALRVTPRLTAFQVHKNIATGKGLVLGEKNVIVDGQAEFVPTDFGERVDRAIAVEALGSEQGLSVVQVDVGPNSQLSLLGAASAGGEGAPRLIDNLDQTYDAVGYFYKDNARTVVRFTPGRPIQALTDVPLLTASRSDQQLTLLFRVTAGVKVKAYAIGTKVVAQLNPPIETR